VDVDDDGEEAGRPFRVEDVEAVERVAVVAVGQVTLRGDAGGRALQGLAGGVVAPVLLPTGQHDVAGKA